MTSIVESDTYILKSPYSELFHSLLKEIDKCVETDLPHTVQFQNCFWASVKWYKTLKQLVMTNGFAREFEEIDFFRCIKPRFTCFIEFFVISSEALWFVNSKAECPFIFWEQEMEKYTRFYNRYSFFIDYYESGKHHYDSEYFLKTKAKAFNDIHSKLFDESPALHSSKDWLVRSYFAHKMYFRFAQDKLSGIVNSPQQKLNNRANQKSVKQNSQHMPGSFSELLVGYMNSIGGYSCN